jgi:exosortase/archaeosortase family protein
MQDEQFLASSDANASHQVGVARRSMGRMALIFVLVAAALQWGWSLASQSLLEKAVIDVATVKTAVAVINALTPDVHARALGATIKAPGGGINVLNGCEGTEVLFLMFAALWSYPLGWRWRGIGMAMSTVLVFGLNQVRLLALFYSYRENRTLFDQLHGLVMPLLLVVAAIGLFVWLVNQNDRKPMVASPQ